MPTFSSLRTKFENSFNLFSFTFTLIKPGITAEKLIAEVKNHGFKDVSYLPNLNDFLPSLDESTEKHTIIMTFGAGSITNFSYTVADYLKERGK